MLLLKITTFIHVINVDATNIKLNGFESANEPNPIHDVHRHVVKQAEDTPTITSKNRLLPYHY